MAWPVVCGSAVAERTHALTFVDGVLRVAVPDTGWKLELQGLAPRYLAAINKYTLGPGASLPSLSAAPGSDIARKLDTPIYRSFTTAIIPTRKPSSEGDRTGNPATSRRLRSRTSVSA